MPFNVLPEEWEKVLVFFKKNPNVLKYSKKRRETQHSFVKLIVDDHAKTHNIFAIANKKFDGVRRLGKGAYGKVKRVKNIFNKEFALKIEKGDANLTLKKEDDPSLQAARTVNFFKGQGLRILENPTLYRENKIYRKRYSLLELVEGQSLFDIIKKHERKPFLTSLQLALIGLISALRILELHEQRIIHAGVKPENLIGIIHGNHIILKPIDYDFSLILSENSTSETVRRPKGSKHYAAPELVLQGEYSFASDVYALGVIYRYLELNQLSEVMIADEPGLRPSLPLIISFLIEQIQSQYDLLDKDATDVLSYALFRTQTAISQYLSTICNLAVLLDYQVVKNYLSFEQCLIIGLCCCQAVLTLHQNKKILINIKPENFLVSIDSALIKAEIKYLGYSCELMDNERYVKLRALDVPRLLPEYSAPESKAHLCFSYATDVYSLGTLLKDLGIDPGMMVSPNEANRPTLREAMCHLIGREAPRCKTAMAKKMLSEMAINLGVKMNPVGNEVPILDMREIENSSVLFSLKDVSSKSVSPLSVDSNLSSHTENTSPVVKAEGAEERPKFDNGTESFSLPGWLNFKNLLTSKKEQAEKRPSKEQRKKV